MAYYDEITMLRLRLGRWAPVRPAQAEAEAAAKARARGVSRQPGAGPRAAAPGARQDGMPGEVERGGSGD